MNPDELLSEIKNRIEQKGTYPKVLSFVEMLDIDGNRDELNRSFLQLVNDKKIRVRQGKNTKLVEVL